MLEVLTGRWRQRARGLTLIALVALLVAGCGATGSSSSSSQTVKITGSTLRIYLSKPGGADAAQLDVVDAEQLAFQQLSGEVKGFQLKLDVAALPKLSANARKAIQDKTAVAYLGDLIPGSSEQSVGITNAVDLLQVSPTDTALELAVSTPAISDTPDKYFESLSTYHRTFARIVPTSAEEASFIASQLQSATVSSLYIGSDGSDYGDALAHALRSAARSHSITLASAEAGASAILYSGNDAAKAATFMNAAASAAPSALLLAPSGLDQATFVSALNAAAKAHLRISTPGLAVGSTTAAAKTFAQAFQSRYGHAPAGQAIFGYTAMQAVLAAIKDAGTGADSRTTVVSDFLKLHNLQTVLGPISIDADGNSSFNSFVWSRAAGSSVEPASGLKLATTGSGGSK
jgi:branched-chain amino acid transport system substrate-binding protein